MSTVAEQLHLAREAKHLTIHQVAEVTKIRTDHLRALEDGNFDVFSAPVYIRGFVRSYAVLLKLDVARVALADLDGELSKTEKFREPPALGNQRRGVVDFLTLQLSKVNWRAATIFLALVIIIGGVVAGVAIWRSNRASDTPVNVGNGIYQPVQGGDTAPLPSSAHH